MGKWVLQYIGAVIITLLFRHLASVWGSQSNIFVRDLPSPNHLIIDEDTNILYIGSINHLYQLDFNLTIIKNISTGPKNDSQKCSQLNFNSCRQQKLPTDNINKVLLLYKTANLKQLIICGSLFQGSCEKRDVSDLGSSVEFKGETEFAVAANDPVASTVAFIASTMDPVTSGYKEMLYVATDFFGEVRENEKNSLEYIYRKDVPAIAIRYLEPDDQALKHMQKQDTIRFNEVYQSPGLIKFVSGFISNNYRYFLLNELVGNSKLSVPKLGQVCQNDSKFYSYTEIPLVCKHNDKEFNYARASEVIKPGKILRESLGLNSTEDILVVGFSDDGATPTSVVCIYSMQYIRNVVKKNIKGCRAGNTSFASEYKYKIGAECKLVQEILTSDEALLCNTLYNQRISGILPAEKNAVIVFQNTTLTSIALSTTTDFTVAFVGTADGTIKKLALKSKMEAIEYGNNEIIDTGSSIKQDMVFDAKRQYIFAMSGRKVAKIKVENCEQYTNCSACLASQDPYCGWCTLENRCVLKSDCPNPTVQRWKYGRPQDCVAIMTVSPPMAPATEKNLLYLTAVDLPINTNYSCVFDFGNGLKTQTSASSWVSGIHCDTPNITNLGVQFGPNGHKNISLGIWSQETMQLFVSTEYTFYKCSSFTNCSSCVDNVYWCDWCILENQCKYVPTDCMGDIIFSRNDTYIDDSNQTEYRPDSPGRRGPLHCPRIDLTATGSLYLPKGVSKTVTVKGVNLPDARSQGGYRSYIYTNTQGTLNVTGTWVDAQQLMFNVPVIQEKFVNGVFKARMDIVWGNNFVVENEGLFLTLYSCVEMAAGDCSFCKSLESSPLLNCRWCGSSKTCLYNSNSFTCPAGNTQCPGPMVTKISPMSGHYLGGTRVTITGSNLGSNFSDIANNVTVVGIACKPIEELYVPSKKIVCTLGAKGGSSSGNIYIMRTKIEGQIFSYRRPVLRKVVPDFKATSGGGTVILGGDYFNIGNNMSVKINDKSCSVLLRNTTNAICRVPPNPIGSTSLVVLIDNNLKEPLSKNFTYVPDPTISGISPLKSIKSGGILLTVVGTSLTSVDTPLIFAYYKEYSDGPTKRTNTTACRVHNDTLMQCPSPLIPLPEPQVMRLKRSTVLLRAKISFIMDNVKSVENLTNVNAFVDYFSDPEVSDFEDPGRVKQKGEILTIKGNNLDVSATKSDVQVFVGTSSCNVTNLLTDSIYCDPPATQPSVISDGQQRGDGTPRVRVVIGNREWVVGYLQYKQPEELNLMMIIVGGVAGSASLVLIIVLITCCVYRRQRNKSKREFKKIQIQLDNLESNVRNECKQAFAELQTDMTDLTNDLDASKEPFYSYEEYTFKVLFPGSVDHVILHPPQQRNGNVDRHPDVAIVHFSQLLHNKHFLLMFIRTLEKQKSFSIRDKSNVASLLIILFQNNMEYITEILKALLHDLIEKSIESRHPKLMLRRTESVVEKLLANWLSLCLYRYLVDSAGNSLYTLYQAIKVQVDKGPIDFVTGDARYSLSEDRLLRTETKLEPEVLTLNVEYDGKKTKCRVLDCDTITQAKEKMLDTIFRNSSYSHRPNANDLDLEWKNKILGDEDSSTVKSDGWKQLNTLKHYKVEDGAEMLLLQHQNMRTLPRSPNGSVHSSGFPFSREAMPITRTESEVGTRIWHLVKQDDSQTSNGGIKLSSEVYLTRLLATKVTLKKYIDDFFKTLLTADNNMPPVIKFLFDFLDDAAKKHGLTEHDVVYTWKCNSLLLRFWVNIIKNPDFVYDINKPNIVDSCLSVVAQTFMDSCSTSEHHLGKDSPSNKLLFAKDIPQFKQWVEKYFRDVQNMPAVSDQDLNAYLAEVSRLSTGYFTRENALHELYNYVHEYTNEINDSLEADVTATAQQLPSKLGHIITSMEGPSSKQAYV